MLIYYQVLPWFMNSFHPYLLIVFIVFFLYCCISAFGMGKKRKRARECGTEVWMRNEAEVMMLTLQQSFQMNYL